LSDSWIRDIRTYLQVLDKTKRIWGTRPTTRLSHHKPSLTGARQVERSEDPESPGEALISKVIANASAFGCGSNETALAKAGEMVGKIRPRCAEVLGHLGGIGRSVDELDKHAPTGVVCESLSHPAKNVEVDR